MFHVPILTAVSISPNMLHSRLRNEGLNPDYAQVQTPCWVETGRCEPGTRTAFLTPCLLARSNGSTVYLNLSLDMHSYILALLHTGIAKDNTSRAYIFKLFPELDGVDLLTDELMAHARTILSWENYVNRLGLIPGGGLLSI